MTIRTLTATIIICTIFTLTGCATKQATKIDSAASSTASTTSATTPAQAGTDKSAEGVITDAVLGQNIATPDKEPSQINPSKSQTYLDPVYFDFDSYLLAAEARDTLSRNARWLAENKGTRVVIEGHADERGSDEYNLALAEKRALAAQRYIETLGISLDRMKSISYGENKPAVIGHDEETWAKNRRVEFVVGE